MPKLPLQGPVRPLRSTPEHFGAPLQRARSEEVRGENQLNLLEARVDSDRAQAIGNLSEGLTTLGLRLDHAYQSVKMREAEGELRVANARWLADDEARTVQPDGKPGWEGREKRYLEAQKLMLGEISEKSNLHGRYKAAFEGRAKVIGLDMQLSASQSERRNKLQDTQSIAVKLTDQALESMKMMQPDGDQARDMVANAGKAINEAENMGALTPSQAEKLRISLREGVYGEIQLIEIQTDIDRWEAEGLTFQQQMARARDKYSGQQREDALAGIRARDRDDKVDQVTAGRASSDFAFQVWQDPDLPAEVKVMRIRDAVSRGTVSASTAKTYINLITKEEKEKTTDQAASLKALEDDAFNYLSRELSELGPTFFAYKYDLNADAEPTTGQPWNVALGSKFNQFDKLVKAAEKARDSGGAFDTQAAAIIATHMRDNLKLNIADKDDGQAAYNAAVARFNAAVLRQDIFDDPNAQQQLAREMSRGIQLPVAVWGVKVPLTSDQKTSYATMNAEQAEDFIQFGDAVSDATLRADLRRAEDLGRKVRGEPPLGPDWKPSQEAMEKQRRNWLAKFGAAP